MQRDFSLSSLIRAGRSTSLSAAIAYLLLLFSHPVLANPDESWFIDKHGREHPGYSFRFTDAPRLNRAIQAQERESLKWLRKRGVVGSAVGWDEDGNPVIRVFGDGASPTDLPAEIDGFAIRLEATGPVYALKYTCREDNPNRAKQCPETAQPATHTGGPSSTTDWHRPVSNGISIGHPSVTAGTVACVVTQGCHTMVLSNNHVLADSNAANVGDLILQPGVFDGGIYPSDSVGTLYDWVDIEMATSATNRVDAAIALIDGQDFTNETFPDGYGNPRASWKVPEAGLDVMKYGRTTRYTEGVITGVNAIVLVNYNTCCARFIGQVVIEPVGNPDFALGGDSGALVVARNGPDDRRPVALVFAVAGDTKVFANPIDDVINQLDIDIVGD